jgi:hypothetical protein
MSPVTFHNIIIDVLKFAESLRSSISKNALILISEMSSGLSRQVDNEIFTIIPAIMKKCTDTNVFLAEEGDKALFEITRHCSETKVISALLQYCNIHNKSQPVKAKTA